MLETKIPFSLAIQEKCPYVYMFAHPRTADDGITKRMLWDPRISRPAPQTNSYLFRAQSKSDIIEVCWILPPREMWDSYGKGKVTESPEAEWSINQFKHNRQTLELPHAEDIPENQARMIMKKIIQEHIQKQRTNEARQNLINSLKYL